jgi:hypothetical protein
MFPPLLSANLSIYFSAVPTLKFIQSTCLCEISIYQAFIIVYHGEIRFWTIHHHVWWNLHESPIFGLQMGYPIPSTLVYHQLPYYLMAMAIWGVCPIDRPNYVGWCWLAILIRSHSCPILTSQTRLLAFSEPFAFNFDPASASFPKEPRLKWVPAWSRCLLLPDWKRNLWWATPRSCELRCWSVDFHRSLALLVNSPIGLPQGI